MKKWIVRSLALAAALLVAPSLEAQSPAVCVVSGTVLDGGSQPIVGTQVRFRTISPTLATTGAALATQDLTTVTAAGGAWSLTLVQGLNAQVDIPAAGIAKDTVIPTGAGCPANFSSLTLYNRGTLTPATILSTVGPSMGGDLTGSSPNPTVVGLRGQTLAAGACTNGQARVYSSGSSSYTCQNVTAGTSVTSITGGTAVTVSGTATVPIVGVTAGAITNTQLGAGAAAANLGAAGGGLTGTYPSPTLATGVAATNVGSLGGDLSGTLPNPTVATVGAQTAANVAAGAVLANAATTANTPSTIVKRDGGGAITVGTVNGALSGNATTATTLSSTLTGDASSSGNAVTVTGLRGRPVNASAPGTGMALTWSGTDWAPAAAIGTVTSVSAAGGGTGLSFSGSPVTGAGTLTLQGTLGIGFGGTGTTTAAGAFDALSPMSTLGDTLYGGASGTRTRLAGNTTTTGMFLRSTGSAGLATAPVWSALVSGDIPSNGANTSGTAAGLSATLVVGSGGTGQTTASGAFNALSPTTTTGDTIYANGAGTNTRLAGNVTTTKNFLVQTGNGATSNAPAWGTIVSGDLPATIAANTSGSAASLSATLGVATGGSGATTFSAGVLHSPGGTGAFATSPVALGSEVSGQLPIANGGTGQATASAAYNALAPTTTTGDFAYANGAGTNTRLAGNATGTKMFMQETSSVPSWGALVAGDIPNLSASVLTSGTVAVAQLPALAGDVTGAVNANTVTKIQGNPVLSGTPSNLQVLQYITANGRYEPTTITAGGTVTSVSGSGGSTGLTLTGGPIVGVGTLTLGGTLAIANGGTGQTTASAAFNALMPLTTLGDTLYASGVNTAARLAGNTTTTKQFLTQTGNGSISAVPAWGTLVSGDVPSLDFSKITTGTVPIAQGGTGATTAANALIALSGVNKDGSVPLTANWTAGNFRIDSQNSTRWYNVVAYGADPSGSADSTTAFNAAITAANSVPGVIYVPRGVFKITATLTTISGVGVHVIGDTQRSSIIQFAPSANGVVFTFSNGGSIVEDTGIQDIGFASVDTTYTKVMVRVSDASHFFAQRIFSASTTWTGATSVGIQTRGRQFIRIRDCWIYADQPISIEPNPNSATISFDHSSVESSELVVTSASTNPAIKIQDNTTLSQAEFRDIAFVRGGHGLYMNQTTGATAHTGINVSLCRWEQNASATGYGIYLASSTAAIQELNVNNFKLDAAARGIYLRNAKWPLMSSISYGGTGEFANFDSSVTGPTFINSFRQTGSTVTDTSTNPTQIGMTVGANPSVSTFGSLAVTNTNPVSYGSGSQLQFSSTGQLGFNMTADAPISLNTGNIHFNGGNSIIYSEPAGAAATTIGMVATSSGAPSYNANGAAMRLADDGASNGTVLFSTNQSGVGPAERMRITNTGLVGIANAAPASTLDVIGNIQQTSTNGAAWISGQSSELLTLNTAGTTTDTSANLLPANSVIRSVVVRVTTSITVASAFSVGDTTTAARFLATGTGLPAGSTGVGLAHVDQTGTSGPRQTAAAKVRITTTGTPSAGQIRITVFYDQFIPPTS